MSRADVLVDADWVLVHRGDPRIALVEVDEDTTAYDKGHIQGAVKLDWQKDLQDPVKRDFVGRARFQALLSERGIANDDTVVLYGGNNNWFAAYAYWYFKIYGHRDVRLLDGGRQKWELDSRELVTEIRRRPTTAYRAQEQDTSIRAYRDEVIAAIGRVNLVDVRSPDEFAGRLLAPAHLPREQAQRGGHIPTASNVPWSKAAGEDGTFKTDDELRALYAQAGVDFSQAADQGRRALDEVLQGGEHRLHAQPLLEGQVADKHRTVGVEQRQRRDRGEQPDARGQCGEVAEDHGRGGGDERPFVPLAHPEPVEAEFLGQARVADHLPEPLLGGVLLARARVRGVHDQRDGDEPHEPARVAW